MNRLIRPRQVSHASSSIPILVLLGERASPTLFTTSLLMDELVTASWDGNSNSGENLTEAVSPDSLSPCRTNFSLRFMAMTFDGKCPPPAGGVTIKRSYLSIRVKAWRVYNRLIVRLDFFPFGSVRPHAQIIIM